MIPLLQGILLLPHYYQMKAATQIPHSTFVYTQGREVPYDPHAEQR
jgi:hypothetical protein